jgi:hypothetical protein
MFMCSQHSIKLTQTFHDSAQICTYIPLITNLLYIHTLPRDHTNPKHIHTSLLVQHHTLTKQANYSKKE